jgi:hypothetical protein
VKLNSAFDAHIYLKERGHEIVDWINLAVVRDHSCTAVNIVVNGAVL